MSNGATSPHLRTAVTTGLLVALLYVLLTALVTLVAGGLVDRLGAGPVTAGTATAAVLSWAVAGWLGSRGLRGRGAPRSRTAASCALGAGLGYLAVPGLLGVVGLVLVGAPVVDLLTGPVLSSLLAAVVATLAGVLAPHAPAAAPYVSR